MSVYVGDEADPFWTQGKSNYSWYNVDQVYDFLVNELNMAPLVELSFCPCALTKCAKNADGSGYGSCKPAFRNPPGSYKACMDLPANWSRWEDLVRAFATHLVQRYGLETVRTWHFEVWNEFQNFGGFSFEEYMQLYASSARALKQVDAQLRVGGPATECLHHVVDFVTECKRRKLPLDFVSTHLYPSDPLQRNGTGGGVPAQYFNESDPDFFAHAVLQAQRDAHAAAACEDGRRLGGGAGGAGGSGPAFLLPWPTGCS